MAKNIFAIRHGEASHQVNPNIWETHSNAEIPLTPLGKSQGEECGRFFADLHINPETTLIITSPYKRATQTAEQIAEKIPSLKIVTEPLLVEQNFGDSILKNSQNVYKILADKTISQDEKLKILGKNLVFARG